MYGFPRKNRFDKNWREDRRIYNNTIRFDPSLLACHYMASQAYQDTNLTNLAITPGTVVLGYRDMSGNNRHASNSGSLQAVSSLGGYQAVRTNFYAMNIANNGFTVTMQAALVAFPYSTHPSYGCFMGPDNSDGSSSNRPYLFEPGTTYFHSNQYPQYVLRNNLSVGGAPYNITPLTEPMVLYIHQTASVTSSLWQFGKHYSFSSDFIILEFMAFSTDLTSDQKNNLMRYFQTKYNAIPQIQ